MDVKQLNKQAKVFAKELDTVRQQIHNVIVGQDLVVDRAIMSLIADGHVLLEGVPGLAKTMLIRTLAQTLHASFTRIQFTPDLLPADIIGTKIYQHKSGKFSTKKGPIFANFILADEINRAPPKVQSALLEAMQERQVTISGDTFVLPKPFLVLATQNPLETEGTYRLPEAQVDRFMFKVLIDYPHASEEKIILERNTEGHNPKVNKVLSPTKIVAMQKFCQQVYADDKIKDYAIQLVDATRVPEKHGLKLRELIEYGASPRATIWLILAGKAHALLQGRGYVMPEDVQAIAHDVLRHRILLTYEAEAEDVTSDQIIDKILAKVNVP